MGNISSKKTSTPRTIGLRLRGDSSTYGILDKCVILIEGTPTMVILYKNGISYAQRHPNWEQGLEAINEYYKDGYRRMKKKDLKQTLAKYYDTF